MRNAKYGMPMNHPPPRPFIHARPVESVAQPAPMEQDAKDEAEREACRRSRAMIEEWFARQAELRTRHAAP